MALSIQRKSIYPENNDDWDSVALRELPDMPLEEACSQLQSWNLHVFMRPAAKTGSAILPSDIIFLEAPLS